MTLYIFHIRVFGMPTCSVKKHCPVDVLFDETVTTHPVIVLLSPPCWTSSSIAFPGRPHIWEHVLCSFLVRHWNLSGDTQKKSDCCGLLTVFIMTSGLECATPLHWSEPAAAAGSHHPTDKHTLPTLNSPAILHKQLVLLVLDWNTTQATSGHRISFSYCRTCWPKVQTAKLQMSK